MRSTPVEEPVEQPNRGGGGLELVDAFDGEFFSNQDGGKNTRTTIEETRGDSGNREGEKTKAFNEINRNNHRFEISKTRSTKGNQSRGKGRANGTTTDVHC
jgi:hypothetical protein